MPIAESYKDGWARVRHRVENRTWIGIDLEGFVRTLPWTSGEVCLKYQLPGEDLDALISVTNDEDLEHMMLEYDRLCRPSNKQARLRLFLFPLTPLASTSFGSNETKSERQWFVDALNSVQIQPLEGSSLQAAASETNPDFLFGLDKGLAPPPPVKLLPKNYSMRSDPGSEIPYKL